MAAAKAPAKMPTERRRVLLGLAHQAALLLGLEEDSRRAAQQAFAGCTSLKDFTDRQLLAWCYELKRRGAAIGVPGPAPRGGQGWERPTPAQWTQIERLALELGLDEAALVVFARRTCGVDDPAWMNRSNASQLIVGLSRWARQGRRAPVQQQEESANVT